MINLEIDKNHLQCNACRDEYDVKVLQIGDKNFKIAIALCRACRSLVLKRLLQEK